MPQKVMGKFGKYVKEHPVGVITTAGVGLAMTTIPVISAVGGAMAIGGAGYKIFGKKKVKK